MPPRVIAVESEQSLSQVANPLRFAEDHEPLVCLLNRATRWAEELAYPWNDSCP
jgi:hypothetical protein